MARFVAVLDTSGKRDLTADLASAEQTMIAGGSRETGHRWVRPGFALLLLAHGEGDASWSENDGRLRFASGFGWAEPRSDFLDACAAALRAPERHSLPVRAREPGGSCLFAAWDPEAEDLVLATEPNGYQPVYYWTARGTTVIASEPKAIWSLAPEPLEVDADKVPELRNTRIICRSGDPTDLYDLAIVNPQSSRSIVVISLMLTSQQDEF